MTLSNHVSVTIHNDTDRTIYVRGFQEQGWRTFGSGEYMTVGYNPGDLLDAFTAQPGYEEDWLAGYEVTARVPQWTIFQNARTDIAQDLAKDRCAQPNEGPADSSLYLQARGDLKAALFFIEFRDKKGGADIAGLERADVGQAPQWFRCESYGVMRLEITSYKYWVTLDGDAADYSFEDFDHQKAFIAAAVDKLRNKGVPFKDYQIFYFVACPTGNDKMRLSPAFIAADYYGVRLPDGGKLRHAVTFGGNMYTKYAEGDDVAYRILIHETCHLFGLPDLYYIQSGQQSGQLPVATTRAGSSSKYPAALGKVGAWDLMNDVFEGRRLLGWHRYKLGWLDKSQIVYLKSGSLTTVLSPLDTVKHEPVGYKDKYPFDDTTDAESYEQITKIVFWVNSAICGLEVTYRGATQDFTAKHGQLAGDRHEISIPDGRCVKAVSGYYGRLVIPPLIDDSREWLLQVTLTLDNGDVHGPVGAISPERCKPTPFSFTAGGSEQLIAFSGRVNQGLVYNEDKDIHEELRALSALGVSFHSPGDGVKAVMVLQSDAVAYVVEVAQPFKVEGDTLDRGVLLYKVDSAVPTGQYPVTIKAYKAGSQASFLPHAPIPVGHGKKNNDVEVTVKKKDGSSYEVKVVKK